jgi:hypothetical protein
MRSVGVVRDPDVANQALRFPLPQGFQVRRRIDQIVDLHEVDPVHAQLPHRVPHLFEAALLPLRPDLRRDERPVADTERRQDLSYHFLGPAVHGGRVNDATTQ